MCVCGLFEERGGKANHNSAACDTQRNDLYCARAQLAQRLLQALSIRSGRIRNVFISFQNTT
jgi:hypothetical protein